MKTMRFAIFSIVLTGADALSLRGNPSLFQAKLPLPEEIATKEAGNKKSLEDMEATLMRLAKSGHVGTPLKNFADVIMPHLSSMEGAINASHTTDQITMNNLGMAFTNCTTAKTNADSDASTMLATKGTQSTAHKNCRTSEGMAQSNYSGCVTAMTSLESSKTTACDAYALANKVPNLNLVPTPGMGSSYRSWLVSVRDWVLNELANLDAANESCVSSTGLYDNKKLECEGVNGQGGLWLVHDNLKTQCNANQTALEGTACSYAAKVESACSGYSTCYSNANSSYHSGKATLLSGQSNRILEYRLVKRLKCFCNLFAAADGSDLASADINTCKNTIPSTLHLSLTLPIVPAAPGTCPVVYQKPCTSNYTSTEYGLLPSNAQAATCQACPSATTTTTTMAQAAAITTTTTTTMAQASTLPSYEKLDKGYCADESGFGQPSMLHKRPMTEDECKDRCSDLLTCIAYNWMPSSHVGPNLCVLWGPDSVPSNPNFQGHWNAQGPTSQWASGSQTITQGVQYGVQHGYCNRKVTTPAPTPASGRRQMQMQQVHS